MYHAKLRVLSTLPPKKMTGWKGMKALGKRELEATFQFDIYLRVFIRW